MPGSGCARLLAQERPGPGVGGCREKGRRRGPGAGSTAWPDAAGRFAGAGADDAGTRSAAVDCSWQVQSGDRHRSRRKPEHRGRASRQPDADPGGAQHGRTRGAGAPQRAGEHHVTRRSFLLGAAALPAMAAESGFHFADVTASAGIAFRHNSGAFGAKYLPETMGPGCAFLDYDGDGWLDILLVNGMDWAGHKQRRSTLRLFQNRRNGTFTDVTAEANNLGFMTYLLASGSEEVG